MAEKVEDQPDLRRPGDPSEDAPKATECDGRPVAVQVSGRRIEIGCRTRKLSQTCAVDLPAGNTG